MSGRRFNEGKACDAVLRHLEGREKAARENLEFPEKAGHKAAPIELTCTLNGALFAFEHTGIEPFDGQIELEADSRRGFGPIEEAVTAALRPREYIQFHVPVHALRGLKNKDIRRIQEAMISWIIATAPTLPIAPIGRQFRSEYVDLPGVPFPVALHCHDAGGYPGAAKVVHILPEEGRDEARLQRLAKACRDKFPKLNHWKRVAGARSVLILEDDDIQLTNQATVAEVVVPLALAAADRPDEIWLVITCTEPWYIVPMLVDRTSYFDLEYAALEIDPRDLVAITGR
ncbi:MAG TPA: hypothetical protein VJ476_15520 [Rhizomicrobium sp.]|nr:hypothetical protein [Rhizomicrobium sp.]